MRQGRPSDHQLDRIERMLERCIEADKASRRKRRALLRTLYQKPEEGSHAESDVFYEKLKTLIERQKELKEIVRRLSGIQDQES